MPKMVETELGLFEKNSDSWICFFNFNGRDLEVSVDDFEGEPNRAQIDFLLAFIPKLPEYELECRRKVDDVDGHDLAGISFRGDCDVLLAFNWGNGEWGQTVFVELIAGRVGTYYTVSD